MYDAAEGKLAKAVLVSKHTNAIFPASNPDIHLAAKADHSVVERPNQVVQRAIPTVLAKMTGRLPIRSRGQGRTADHWHRSVPDNFPQ